MEETKKIMIIDENGDGSISSDEVIGISPEILKYHKEHSIKDKSDKFAEKTLKIKTQKERVMDKSFEL